MESSVVIVYAIDPWDERTVLKVFDTEEKAMGYIASLQEAESDGHFIYTYEERAVE